MLDATDSGAADRPAPGADGLWAGSQQLARRPVSRATTLGAVPEQPPPVSTPANARPKNRQVSGLARIGMIFFVIGLLAVAVIMVLFATGSTELPLWLNLVAMLAPVGFGLGLVAIFVEARTSRRASALRDSGRPGSASKAGVT